MDNHTCVKQKEWGKQEEFNARVLHHIIEGEKEGGHRDRLAKLEVGMHILLGSGKWFIVAASVGGFIGGILGRFMPWLVEAMGRTLGMR